MVKQELLEALKVALNTYEFDGETMKAVSLSHYITTLEAEPIKNDFHDGVIYALDYLSDLYDGLDETDIWAEYMEADTDNDKEQN